ncbi:DUF5333 domain-containing protein [Roseovarius ramblicola]|uniref:DUF5333 domain-containing protein n=1 Tax=Roseovarius ramblicola TaxID=2022336 RepID=A0ABV5I271_9RHOB
MIRVISRDCPALAGAWIVALAVLCGTEVRAGTLAQETGINQRLVEMSVADEIRKRCDSISARFFAGLKLMMALRSEARERGYTAAEIEDYVSDKEEKRKIRGRADAYIRAHGAEPNDGPSLCALGQSEIAKQSRIGALLRAR